MSVTHDYEAWKIRVRCDGDGCQNQFDVEPTDDAIKAADAFLQRYGWSASRSTGQTYCRFCSAKVFRNGVRVTR